MDLARLLAPERVIGPVDARSKKRALELVADALSRGDDGLGQGEVFTSLVGRERLGSTAIGHGVAMPHGRVAGVAAPRGAFVRLAEPIEFETPDGVPVDLLFGVVVPAQCSPADLAALAAVSTRLQHDDLLTALRRATDAHAVYRVLVDGGRRRATG